MSNFIKNSIFPLPAVFVPKGWGGEVHIVNNIQENYCGKLLKIKEGKQLSIHFHALKHETFYLLSGEVEVTLINTDNADRHIIRLRENEFLPIPRNLPHSIKALKDSVIIEFSTFDRVSDSYRVEKGDSQKS